MRKRMSGLLLGAAFYIIRLAYPSQAMDERFVDSSIGKNPFPISAYSGMSASTLHTPPAQTIEREATSFFYVHSGQGSLISHYIPSGWMGDYGDLRLSNSYTENPSHSKTCLKITYSGLASQGAGWAGIYWQNPSNNWGNAPGGYNLQGMRRLTFWARGAEGGERVAVFKIGGIEGIYADSDTAQIGPIQLTADWRQYSIDLTNVDLSRVMGGFAWAASRVDNSGPIAFYLDQIRYER
jgi:hypothetical protein